jgi:predicted HicB family RNase H-like nuclease
MPRINPGREPEKPFSGKLVIQANPELHRRVALEVACRHVSMDTYIQEVLEKALTTESHL